MYGIQSVFIRETMSDNETEPIPFSNFSDAQNNQESDTPLAVIHHHGGVYKGAPRNGSSSC